MSPTSGKPPSLKPPFGGVSEGDKGHAQLTAPALKTELPDTVHDQCSKTRTLA